MGLWDPGLVQFVWWVGLCLSPNSQAETPNWHLPIPSVLMVKQAPQILLPVSMSPVPVASCLSGSLSVSVDGSDLGAFQITVFVLGLSEMTCVTFKGVVSVSIAL